MGIGRTGFISMLLLSGAMLAQSIPVPLLNQPLVPTTVVPGSPGFTLTVNGTGFVSGSTVYWNGSPRTTTFVSGSQLTSEISAADVAVGSTALVTVVTAGSGTSNALSLGIALPKSVLSYSSNRFNPGSEPSSMALADLNNDGKQDLIVTNFAGGGAGASVSVFLTNGDGTFEPGITFGVEVQPRAVVAGDVNRDGKLDLIVANGAESSISVFLGNGDGTFQPGVDYNAAGEPLSLVVADFNEDGKLDVAIKDSGTSVAVLLGNGDGTFQSFKPYTVGNGNYGLAVGDFNADGHLDLASSNELDDSVSILLGNGDGTFQTASSLPAGGGPTWVSAADLNGDGKLDLAVANASNSGLGVSIFLGNGDGTFQPRTDYLAGGSPRSIAVGDLNGDGKLDLAVPSYGNGFSVLLGNGDGTFQAPLTYSIDTEFAVAADFNGDGLLDLAFTDSDGSGWITLQDPVVTLSPGNINFPPQKVGVTSAPASVVTTNTGVRRLTFKSVTIRGTNASDFSQRNNCSILAGGKSCTVLVAFTPSAKGPRSALLLISDDGGASPQKVALTGKGE
jgi:hypothetical protein